jgi:DNA damage-binding protein 2
VDAAVLKLHARRTTCLEFHPHRDNIVLSGDKSGQIAVWDIDKVFERTVYTDINRWLTNAIRFLSTSSLNDATCATSSYDGTVKLFDCEVGVPLRTLVDANPRGWEHVAEEDKAGNWATFLGLDVMPQYNVVVAGDSKGRLYFLDPRAEKSVAVLQACKKNTKLQCVDVNLADGAVVLIGGNDHQARILDARRLRNDSGICNADSVAEIASFPHPRVINGASFSRVSGRKILTTCQDNRLRVWDYWATAESGAPPDREIVHSHTFNRHLTAFKAEWDPKDLGERAVVVGRYISEDVGGMALHPVDIIDAATGALVDALADPNLTTICPVNKPHPRRDVIVTGSSRSLYAWIHLDRDDESDSTTIGEGIEGCSQGNRGGLLRPNSKFLFFDADERAQGKKTRRKGGEGKTVDVKRSKHKGGDLAKDDSDSD